ncbi:hypothetical protein FRZ67_20130 [Panacibacter ginsenosidivorans]|uniref:Uncharacterized protein n=1 Tax=Panacibacter ginsenosidivorans TaxID=1813871 RepID=A0A5B8VEK8_9BACT|nr:hypothetical protein [Panacibacter ginsenosidivorans]QEC69495.1 hypothetical protein FRZ67_20130 [Panacibacter ginsenosidivorans]
MKNTDAQKKNTGKENPVREGKPNSIADNKTQQDKKQYPYPSEKDKQYKDQPEFIDPGSNSSESD